MVVSKKLTVLSAEIRRAKEEGNHEKHFRLLTKKNQLLSNQFRADGSLKLVDDDSPFPMWVKTLDGIVLDINRAFEVEILHSIGRTRSEYVGETDFAVFPESAAMEYKKNDDYVKMTGKVSVQSEYNPPSDTYITTLKWPCYKDGVLFAIAGMAVLA